MAIITCTVSGTIVVSPQGVVNGPVASASGGTAPYTYKWYRGATSGFTPDTVNGTNQISNSADNPAYLIHFAPTGVWYYKCVATDNIGDTAGTSAASGPITVVQDATTFTMDVSGDGAFSPNAGASEYFNQDRTVS